MLTTKDVEKASELIELRKSIAVTKWTHVIKKVDAFMRQGLVDHTAEPFDDKLAFAVEEYRARRLDKIDTELRELGVDLTAAADESPDDNTVRIKSGRS